MFVGRNTEYELQQILRKPEWFRNTVFYLAGVLLNSERLNDLGIVAAENSE